MQIKAVLFDLDGVLVDTMAFHKLALEQAIEQYWGPFKLDETFDAIPTKQKLVRLTNEFGLPIELHEKIFNLKQELTSNFIEGLKPKETTESCMSLLRLLNIRIACCSNAIASTIIKCLDMCGYSKYINLIASNECIINAKPAPDIYSHAVAFFKLQPAECLVVEDSDRGIAAGIAAQCHVLKVDINTNLKEAVFNKILEISEKYDYIQINDYRVS